MSFLTMSKTGTAQNPIDMEKLTAFSVSVYVIIATVSDLSNGNIQKYCCLYGCD